MHGMSESTIADNLSGTQVISFVTTSVVLKLWCVLARMHLLVNRKPNILVTVVNKLKEDSLTLAVIMSR